MTIRGLPLLFALAAASQAAPLTAQPAYAQEAGAQALRSELARSSAPTSVYEFSDCLVQATPDRMQEWVNFDGPGLIYKELAAVSERTGCGITATFDYWDLRGALAEGLVRSKLDNLPDFTSARPLTDTEMALRWGNNDGRRSMLLNVFSECAVRQSSPQVVAVLQTEPRSVDERKKLAALKSATAQCQTLAGGVSLRERDATLRGRLAVAVNQMLQLRTIPESGTN